ncbi:MAG: polyphosphate kinase 1 [Verrucomicrobiota bacterium]
MNNENTASFATNDLPQALPAQEDGAFDDPELYINRELSWLQFNQRVLEEAQDATHPLLERVKFLCIVSSNMDEFFEIRVAGLKQQIENKTSDIGPDGLTAMQVFQEIKSMTQKIVDAQYDLWQNELIPELAKQKIFFHNPKELNKRSYDWIKKYFHSEIYPVLTPLAIDPAHPFPQLLNKSLNIIAIMEKPGTPGEIRHAIVQVPRVLHRLIEIPSLQANEHSFIFLSNVITHFVSELFPGSNVLGAWAFRITRNSDLYIDEEEAQNLLSSIEEELRNRNKGGAVRIEVENTCPGEVIHYLLKVFHLTEDDLYVVRDPINILRLMAICGLETHPHLRDAPFNATTSLHFRTDNNVFRAIRNQDILVHHPYESFACVTGFLECAAEDPKVLAIKMTLYRTSGDSPIVKALIHAAQKGKQVTVLVELRARFDEANNIAWARRMEDAGIHVVYGLVGFKTHCKTLMVVRRDDDCIRHYLHLGTGNYHPKTARLYTDIGLFTVNKQMAEEVSVLFNTLTGMSDYPGFQKLLVAPFDMADKFEQLIHAEAEYARQGKRAYIFAKMNSLVDSRIIKALYYASQAGVKIDLLIRGICCLRPRIPGISHNIRVLSIVDRFLEHSRIFYFEQTGHPKLYVGSADWMPRNLYRRIEVIFPVEDNKLIEEIKQNIIDVHMKDNVKARYLNQDGTYTKRPKGRAKACRSQRVFMNRAEKDNQHPPQGLSQTRQLAAIPPPSQT